MKKILSILVKIIVGCFLFYLVVCWIVLPLTVGFLIKQQGTKILKHPVSVRAVSFNPFLWTLNLKGFQILDAGQVVAGFEMLSVDVSFKELLKKHYRVESVHLDGLLVKAIREADGTINLLKLIPAPPSVTTTEQPAPAQTPAPNPSPAPVEKKELPLIVIDQLILNDAVVSFEDRMVTPIFSTKLGDINVTVKNISTNPDEMIDVTFKGLVDGKGLIEAKAQGKPLKKPLEMESSVTIGSYILTVLSPYVGKYTGRSLADGQFDFQTTYKISANKLNATHKILVQKFTFGDKVNSPDALNLPYNLALALLEDPQGRINISLPVEGDMSDPQFEYTHLLWQVVRNFGVKLMTKPFAIIGSLLGASESSTEELGTVKFKPGQATLSDEEKTKLTTLVKGLKERPKLLLEINGSIDPATDWKAIKTDVFNRDYKTLRAESKKNEAWIYEQLYQRRFGIKDLWKLAKVSRQKGEDEATLLESIKRGLIEDSSPDKLALDVLAQERAKIIYDFLIQAGMDANRLKIGNNKETQSNFDYVPLEFTLTIVDSAEKTSEAVN
jgi:hypothetical protein